MNGCSAKLHEDVEKDFFYASYLPHERESEPSPRKLYVLFHPAGSTGSEFLEHWSLLSEKTNDVIFAPTADQKHPYGSQKFERAFFTVISRLKDRYQIDDEQIVLIAESNGVIYGYKLLASKPDFFRAVVFISGMMDEATVRKFQDVTPRIGVPILILHGAEDTIFDEAVVEEQYYFLKSLGWNATFRRIEGLGHGSDVFLQDDVVDWIVNQESK